MLGRCAFALATLVSMCAQAKETKRLPGKAVLNGELEAILETEFGRQKIRGRYSGGFSVDPDSGEMQPGGFNVFYENVLGHTLMGLPDGKVRDENPFTTLGFSASSAESRLSYDQDRQTISAKLIGSLSSKAFGPLPEEIRQKFEKGPEVGVLQRATLLLSINLDQKLSSDESNEPKEIKSKVEALTILGETNDDFKLPAVQITVVELIRPTFEFIFDLVWKWEAARRLCLQPVVIAQIDQDNPFCCWHETGRGWQFGLPGLKEEWAKADVVFEERPIKRIWKKKYWDLTEEEADDLLDEVDDADCVEIFFVHEFSPNDMWGGGRTVSIGTPDSKVISTDENAVHDIDHTHLAHEVGHAMALMHPGDGFPKSPWLDIYDGSKGSVLCPSGFKNDNPQVNSQWNKEHISHSLFQFFLKRKTSDVDCEDSSGSSTDCGSC